ncbi:hypothetical protein P7K49_014758 [Saguinus oedipus]|uniref:Uncharacterized protein n=1 Tax=Saguinus oedipus TaxID=9490 RepID=A0ABQ9V7A6_SAGOE|nr:hypothetical protein P7K49_014758 [Saguinus oedipus]
MVGVSLLNDSRRPHIEGVKGPTVNGTKVLSSSQGLIRNVPRSFPSVLGSPGLPAAFRTSLGLPIRGVGERGSLSFPPSPNRRLGTPLPNLPALPTLSPLSSGSPRGRQAGSPGSPRAPRGLLRGPGANVPRSPGHRGPPGRSGAGTGGRSLTVRRPHPAPPAQRPARGAARGRVPGLGSAAVEGTEEEAMATPGNLGSSVLASKTKTKKKHFVAQKVKLFRASDPLLSVLMWGVNHSVRARLRRAVPFLLFFLLAPLLLRLQLLRGGEPQPALALRLLARLGAPGPAARAPKPSGPPGHHLRPIYT